MLYGVARAEGGLVRLRARVRQIGGLLEEKAGIPMVNAQMPLLQDVQTDEWWEDVTVPMLEATRRRLRDLVQLMDKRQRRPVYTAFEDVMGGETEVELPGFAAGTDQAKFVAKVRAFLRQRLDHMVISKLRTNRPLTAGDLAELERLLAESGAAAPEDVRRAADEARGLGLFVRSLVSMDRAAAKEALAGYTNGKTPSANQLEFVNLIVDHSPAHGAIEPARLYESPFTHCAEGTRWPIRAG